MIIQNIKTKTVLFLQIYTIAYTLRRDSDQDRILRNKLRQMLLQCLQL